MFGSRRLALIYTADGFNKNGQLGGMHSGLEAVRWQMDAGWYHLTRRSSLATKD